MGGKSMRQILLANGDSGGRRGGHTNQAAYPQTISTHTIICLETEIIFRQDTSIKPHMSHNSQEEKFYTVYNQSQSTFHVIYVLCYIWYLSAVGSRGVVYNV